MGHAEAQRAQTGLVRACDVVYGVTCVAMALLATREAAVGLTGPGMPIALWGMVAGNLAWSRLTVHHDRVRSDFLRALVFLPFTAYMYGAQASGVFGQFWLPAFMQSVAVCLSLGIGTRRLRASLAIAVVYACAVALAGGLAPESFHDAIGVWLGATILSIVAVQLGRTLVDATEQRDEAQQQRARSEVTLGQLTERTAELTRAIEDLHREMERRVQLEAELAHAQKLESVGRLAAGIAHEINTPVQFVGASLHFMREGMRDLLSLAQQTVRAPDDEIDLPYLAEELPKAIDRAEDGLGRVAKIVRSMNIFAHPDTDAIVPADLNRAIEAAVVIAHNEYRYVADVELDFDRGLPLVSCCVGEVSQAVLNIVINAAHAIGDARAPGSSARGRICVRTRQALGHAVIEVADDGPGIPASARGRLFDPFFTTKPVGRGTGQGLTIAHAVAEKHGGQLTFETELGAGTTFFLRLPLAGRAAGVAVVAAAA